MRVAVIRDRARREVHEPRLPPEPGRVGHAVRRRNAFHSRPFEVEVVEGRRVVHLHGVGPRRERSAVEVVPLRITERDLATPLVLDDADQRPASRRAVVRRRRRERRSQAVHRAVAGAGIHASAGVLAPGVERGHLLTRIGVALGVRHLELDVPERGRAVVAVDVAAEQRGERWIANDVAARDRAAARVRILMNRVREDRRRLGRTERLLLIEVMPAFAAAPAVVRAPAIARRARAEVDLLPDVLADVADGQVTRLAVEREPPGIA